MIVEAYPVAGSCVDTTKNETVPGFSWDCAAKGIQRAAPRFWIKIFDTIPIHPIGALRNVIEIGVANKRAQMRLIHFNFFFCHLVMIGIPFSSVDHDAE